MKKTFYLILLLFFFSLTSRAQEVQLLGLESGKYALLSVYQSEVKNNSFTFHVSVKWANDKGDFEKDKNSFIVIKTSDIKIVPQDLIVCHDLIQKDIIKFNRDYVLNFKIQSGFEGGNISVNLDYHYLNKKDNKVISFIKKQPQTFELNLKNVPKYCVAPVISWISPDNTFIVSENKRFGIRSKISSASALKKLNIQVKNEFLSNDKVYPIIEYNSRNIKTIELNELIDLRDGFNEVTIFAENTNNCQISDKRTIRFMNKTGLDSSIMYRNDLVLMFATDEYDNWKALVNPINDASALAKELENTYGFEVELIKNPSTIDVMNKLKEYAKRKYGQKDQLMIFFAGHGQYDEFFKEGYVVCKNSFLNDEGKTSYLSHSTLRTVVNSIPCNHTFLILDVCFGGTFDRFIAQADNRGNFQYAELSKPEFIQKKLKFKTRRYLTSGGKEYVPDGRPGHHSPFTRKLLEALRSYGGSDKVLTLNELIFYVEKIVPQPRFGEFGNNEPGSDFIFIAK